MEDDDKNSFKVELVDVFMKTRTEEYKKICPRGVAPCLELSDGTTIWESNTIMRYFCDITSKTSPLSRQLYPPVDDDPVRRAKINMVLDWRQCDFYPKLPDVSTQIVLYYIYNWLAVAMLCFTLYRLAAKVPVLISRPH